jgi:hypothetical protein
MRRMHLPLVTVLLATLAGACASSRQDVPFTYQFEGRKSQDATSDLYQFRYAISGGEFRPLPVYVGNGTELYVITFETLGGNTMNRFEYSTRAFPNNFRSDLLQQTATVNSLNEAIDLAVRTYIANVKVPAWEKEHRGENVRN